MKLSINARFLTQPITGVQRYARELTRRLIYIRGAENIYLLSPNNAIDSFEGIPLIKSSEGFNGHLWEQCRLPFAINKIQPDLLFSPGNTGPLIISNQVATIHDASVYYRPEGYSKNFVRAYRFLLPRLAKRVSRVITVSEFSRNEIMSWMNIPEEKIKAIPNGVSSVFKPIDNQKIKEFKEKKGLPDRFILGLASRAVNKNFTGLIKAWELITKNKELVDTYLVIAGGGNSNLQYDMGMQKLSEIPRVFDIGYVTDEELPLLYNAAAAFIFPSFYEGFGLPPLEAMACGTPVVVSNTASIPGVVADSGIYIDPHNIDDIAGGIYKLLIDNELRMKLKEKGLERAKQFTWENTARQTLQVFEEAIAEQRSKKLCK